MKRKWIKKMLGGLSLTSALFVFQACYGTPQDMMFDMEVEGIITSRTTGKPIEGIKVSMDDNYYEYSNENGSFSFYTEISDSISLHFEDVDSTQNSTFHNKDTVVTNLDNHVFLNIQLEEK